MSTWNKNLHTKLSFFIIIFFLISLGIFLYRSSKIIYENKRIILSKMLFERSKSIEKTLNILIKNRVRDAEILFDYSKLKGVSISSKLKEFTEIEYLVFIDLNTKNFEFIGVEEGKRPILLPRLLKYLKYEVTSLEFESYQIPAKDGGTESRLYLAYYSPKIKQNVFIAVKETDLQNDLTQDRFL